MMVLMVEMMLMMIPMMPGVMVMTMTAIPLREGNSPADFSLPELFFSLSGFRLVEVLKKLFVDIPVVFRSMGGNTPKGSHKDQGRVPPAAKGGPAAGGRPCPLELLSVPPFGSVTYPLKY